MLNGNTLYLETDWFDFRIPSKDSKNVIRFSDITFPLGLIRKINPSNSDQIVGTYRSNQIRKQKVNLTNNNTEPTERFPDLYSVLKKAGGITAFSDLSNIQVIRKNPLSKGGGKIKAEINFIDVIQLSDDTNNIIQEFVVTEHKMKLL